MNLSIGSVLKDYFHFVKIEHTLFSLPIVFSGVFLARSGNVPSLRQSFWIVLAVLGARSAGFGMNRLIDRKIDAENPRTKYREIPSGKIGVGPAWFFVALSSLIFFVSADQLSKICFYLAPIPLILFWVYPFLKRMTLWTHLGLGLAWGIAPIGGWLAVSPQIVPLSALEPVLLLSGFCIFWVAGFDVIYALLDEEFDKQRKLFSIPAVLGTRKALRISKVLHFTAFMFLGTLAEIHLKTVFSFFLLTAVGILFIISHWKVALRPHEPSVVDFAFFKVNAISGFLIFFMMLCQV